MRFLINCPLKQIRQVQLHIVMSRSRSTLCCSVFDKRLSNNKPLPLVSKVHQESFSKPEHITKAEFADTLLLQRKKLIFDENTGVAPTSLQCFFLVLTRLYETRKQIPEFIAGSTMNRMYNRMRAVLLFVATSIFYVLFFAFYRTMAFMVSFNKKISNFIQFKER